MVSRFVLNDGTSSPNVILHSCIYFFTTSCGKESCRRNVTAYSFRYSLTCGRCPTVQALPHPCHSKGDWVSHRKIHWESHRKIHWVSHWKIHWEGRLPACLNLYRSYCYMLLLFYYCLCGLEACTPSVRRLAVSRINRISSTMS